MALQLLIAAVGARENGRTQNHPCDGGAHKNERQRQNLSQQKISSSCDRSHCFVCKGVAAADSVEGMQVRTL